MKNFGIVFISVLLAFQFVEAGQRSIVNRCIAPREVLDKDSSRLQAALLETSGKMQLSEIIGRINKVAPKGYLKTNSKFFKKYANTEIRFERLSKREIAIAIGGRSKSVLKLVDSDKGKYQLNGRSLDFEFERRDFAQQLRQVRLALSTSKISFLMALLLPNALAEDDDDEGGDEEEEGGQQSGSGKSFDPTPLIALAAAAIALAVNSAEKCDAFKVQADKCETFTASFKEGNNQANESYRQYALQISGGADKLSTTGAFCSGTIKRARTCGNNLLTLALAPPPPLTGYA